MLQKILKIFEKKDSLFKLEKVDIDNFFTPAASRRSRSVIQSSAVTVDVNVVFRSVQISWFDKLPPIVSLDCIDFTSNFFVNWSF